MTRTVKEVFDNLDSNVDDMAIIEEALSSALKFLKKGLDDGDCTFAGLNFADTVILDAGIRLGVIDGYDGKTERVLRTLARTTLNPVEIPLTSLRSDEESAYRFCCNFCEDGKVWLERSGTSYSLEPNAYCMLCGTAYKFTDFDEWKNRGLV